MSTGRRAPTLQTQMQCKSSGTHCKQQILQLFIYFNSFFLWSGSRIFATSLLKPFLHHCFKYKLTKMHQREYSIFIIRAIKCSFYDLARGLFCACFVWCTLCSLSRCFMFAQSRAMAGISWLVVQSKASIYNYHGILVH